MNPETPPSKPYWNIFAYELQKILKRQGLQLEQLTARAGINQEKVLRLVASLSTSPDLPMLDAEELEQVIQALHFDDHAILALRAAIDTSAVQKMLCLLIDQESAGRAAKQLFPIILNALEVHPELGRGTRRGDGDTREDSRMDRVLKAAANAIDDGHELLYLSQNVISYNKQVEKARAAEAAFLEAIQYLNRLNNSTQQHHYYVERTQKGLFLARKRLRDLGV